jgi:DNA-binding IclR family transcriptional regulator
VKSGAQTAGDRRPVDPGMSQSLERGLAVLALFKSGRPLMGVSEIGRALELTRSTAHRYVATLAALGYLQQDRESKRYRLGPRVLDLGFSAINSMDVREISAPHLQQLSDDTVVERVAVIECATALRVHPLTADEEPLRRIRTHVISLEADVSAQCSILRNDSLVSGT